MKILISNKLLRIVAPHFVCGIVLDGDTVVMAAPIVKYMVRWKVDRVYAYCRKNGWSVTAME
jgi:hypothetical protein